MTDLEQYIRANAAEFDTQEPARGHEGRFLARLGQAEPAPGLRTRLADFFALRPRRTLAYALAAFAAVLLLLHPAATDDFRGVSDDPEAIYMAYMDQVASLYDALPAGDSASRDDDLRALTEEEIPLFEQLPDGLPARERGRILKAYYGELLAGARQLK